MYKILIVEDSMTFLDTFRQALVEKYPSMEIKEAHSGEKAFEILEDFSPDIIFMDIRLPGENGLKLTKRIKKERPEILIIILTDYDIPEYREAAFKNGANDFIPKGSLHFPDIEKAIRKMKKTSD